MAQAQFRVRGGLLSDSDLTLNNTPTNGSVSYTHLRANEPPEHLVSRGMD